MQRERDFEALNKYDEGDSDFSDEEVTPQEEDLQVVLDRVISYLKENKSSRPKLKSALLQHISTMNTVVSYVSVVDVIEVLAAQVEPFKYFVSDSRNTEIHFCIQ